MIPKESTVLIARGATMGRSCLLGEDMAINQTCYALVPDREKVGPYFLFYSIKLLDSFFQKIAHGAIFNTVIGSGLRETDINLPPSPPNAALPVFSPPWMTKSNSTARVTPPWKPSPRLFSRSGLSILTSRRLRQAQSARQPTKGRCLSLSKAKAQCTRASWDRFRSGGGCCH